MTVKSAARLWVAGLAALPACATKGQVQMLETEVRTMRVETARRDSIRAAGLAAILNLQQRIMDSVAAGREALRRLDTRLQADLTDVQRQLLQVQELTGQSQQRLSELKAGLDARTEQSQAAGGTRPPGDTGGRFSGGGGGPPPGTPSADQMYQSARSQHLRGASGTARMGYQDFLKAYPGDPRAPDALFYVGDTFGDQVPDSAVAYYNQVVSRFPQASRASTALLRLGRIAESRRNPGAARTYYERIIREYPRSDDVDLAQERLKILRP